MTEKRLKYQIMLIRNLCFMWLFLVMPSAFAGLSETQRGELIAASNKLGSAVWLSAGSSPFLGLYYDPTPNLRRGAVLLLHDAGGTPDIKQVIAPLRQSLGDYQWATLAIQLPALPDGLLTEEERYRRLGIESRARISAALDHLASQKITSVVLIGHGLGASLGYQYLGATPPDRQAAMIKGVVSIDARELTGMPADLQPIAFLEKASLPIFDIFSMKQRTAGTLRMQAAQRANNTKYRQLSVVGVNNDFLNSPTLLTSRVRGWLKQQFGGNTQLPGAKK